MKAFQYMILSKIVGDRLNEVNNVVLSKQGKDYYAKEVEDLRSIEVAVKGKSLKNDLGQYWTRWRRMCTYYFMYL